MRKELSDIDLYKEIFSENLRFYMKKRSYSQQIVANAIGVSRQTISNYLSKSALPDAERLLDLSALFSVPIDYLLKKQGERVFELPEYLNLGSEKLEIDIKKYVSRPTANEYLVLDEKGKGMIKDNDTTSIISGNLDSLVDSMILQEIAEDLKDLRLRYQLMLEYKNAYENMKGSSDNGNK